MQNEIQKAIIPCASYGKIIVFLCNSKNNIPNVLKQTCIVSYDFVNMRLSFFTLKFPVSEYLREFFVYHVCDIIYHLSCKSFFYIHKFISFWKRKKSKSQPFHASFVFHFLQLAMKPNSAFYCFTIKSILFFFVPSEPAEKHTN